MIAIDLQNVFACSNPLISKGEFENYSSKLKGYLEKIQKQDIGFYKYIFNEFDGIKKYAKDVEGLYEEIIILGIGGSALGTICLKDALEKVNSSPRLTVLDNIDPYLIENTLNKIELSKTLFIVISKSGSTPETLAQYLFFRNEVEKNKLDAKNHFVFITDNEKGFLREVSIKENIKSFDIPENIGGRFSVLTAVGLLPACLIGINIDNLLTGARQMSEKFLSGNFDENICFQTAVVQYLLYKKGVNINVLMPYSNRLKTFSAWYTQLLAESIGKIDRNGESIGITPVGSLGATDQHSQVQLYNEGPNDKLLMFLEVKNHQSTVVIPSTKTHTSDLDYLKNVSFEKLLNTELSATRDTLNEYGKANLSVRVDFVDAHHLGALFLLFEGATAFLGELLEVNTYDQPGVENGKILTRKYLS